MTNRVTRELRDKIRDAIADVVCGDEAQPFWDDFEKTCLAEMAKAKCFIEFAWTTKGPCVVIEVTHGDCFGEWPLDQVKIGVSGYDEDRIYEADLPRAKITAQQIDAFIKRLSEVKTRIEAAIAAASSKVR